MDTSTQSEEVSVPVPKSSAKRPPKRAGQKVQATPAKRKAVTNKANTTATNSPSINAEAMFNAISSGKSAVKVDALWLVSELCPKNLCMKV